MSTRAGLAIIALLIILVAMGFALSGCATRAAPPFCGSWKAQLFVNDGELMGVYLAKPEAERMMAMVDGLAAGTCRLRPSGARL